MISGGIESRIYLLQSPGTPSLSSLSENILVKSGQMFSSGIDKLLTPYQNAKMNAHLVV